MVTYFYSILQLVRLDKPIGLLLLLWPTWIALLFAYQGLPPTPIIGIFSAGVVIMRSFGCVINDILDRDLDPQVLRTRARPLAAGTLSLPTALGVAMGLAAIALSLLRLLPPRCWWVGAIGALGTLIYPCCKRFFACPQLVLGLVFSLGVPMAYLSLHSHLDRLGWILYLTSVCWVVGFDTLYAMADRACDLKIGIRSSAILFGKWDTLAVSILLNLAWLGFGVAGGLVQAGWPYGLGLAAAYLSLRHQLRLCQAREPEKCLQAFLHNHYFGMSLCVGLFINQLIRQ